MPSGQKYEVKHINCRLPAMRSLSVQGMQRIYHLRMEEAIPAPPLIDKMFGAGFPY